MRPGSEGGLWERRLLAGSALLLVVGYGLVSAVYFMAPQPWTMRIEYWLYQHLPIYNDCKIMGEFLLLGLWLSGCALLLKRSLGLGKIPWAGIGLAALTPGLLLFFNGTFFLLADHIAPLSVGR